MSKVPITSLMIRAYPEEVENMATPFDFFYGGSGTRLESLPDNVISFFSGGDHTRNPAGLHPRYTLILNLREQCNICVDTKIFSLAEGEGILVLPFQLHHFQISDNIRNHRRFVITFVLKNPDDTSLFPLKNQPFSLDKRDMQILIDIRKLYHKSQSKYRSEIPHLLALFLANKLNRTEGEFFEQAELPLPSDHCKQILDFIYANYLRPITIKEISDHIGLSPSQVRLIFKKMTNGISLGKFIDNLRLFKSTEILMHSNMRIHEVASLFGFSDPFTFSRAFKKRFLVSPKRYRILKGRL